MRIVQGDFEATPNENYCSENNNDKKRNELYCQSVGRSLTKK